MAVTVSSFLWRRMTSCSSGGRRGGSTCWVPCLLLSLLQSLRPSLSASRLKLSLPFLSSASISPPFLPPFPFCLASHLHFSVSASFYLFSAQSQVGQERGLSNTASGAGLPDAWETVISVQCRMRQEWYWCAAMFIHYTFFSFLSLLL